MKRETTSVMGRVQEEIREIPLGQPFTPSAVVHLGTRANIDQVLSRLVKSGHIERLTRGVYVKPQVSRHIGKVRPEAIKIVQAIASSSNQVISITGAEAARRFGLSTQMPTKPIFLTSGKSRSFKIGKATIELRHAPARYLSFAGRPAGEALVALRYLGKELVTTQTIKQVKKGLGPEEFELLKSPSGSIPSWLGDIIYKCERGVEMTVSA